MSHGGRRRAVAAAVSVLAGGLVWAGGTVARGAPGVPAGPRTTATATGSLASSLPTVANGHRPGPDILYAPPPRAPQLENRDPRFRAAPLLVSGADAYVDGEYLYQDFIHDDFGADTSGEGGQALSYSSGDITYPTDAKRYAGNAADLVELRIVPGPASVAYRITLNTLTVPDSTIVSIAYDTDRDAVTGKSTLPRDPGAPFPGTDEVITTWGSGAEHSKLGASVTTTPVAVTTDLEANQITLTVPRSVSDPHTTWKATVAVGLYDKTSGGWLKPVDTETETAPGGAGTTGAGGIFNLGFRFDEPALTKDVPPDTAQATALRQGTPTTFQHPIDFAALDHRTAKTTVPATGTMMRIYPSRLGLPEGRNLDQFPELRGQLQPYSLYVPTTYRPGTRVGFTMQPHSLSDHHWQYNGSKGVQQIGEQRNNIVATGEGHGDDGWAIAEAEADVFEVWNDVAAHYDLDPDHMAICGYSMGGYSTYRLGGLYPDLFGKAFTTVGPPIDGIWVPGGNSDETLSNLWLENVRNIPFLNVNAAMDELVPLPGPRAQNIGAPELGIRGFDQLGYRFRWQVYTPAEHLTLAVLSYDLPQAVDFLGDAHVDRDPNHVTFAYVPMSDNAKYGLVHNHAYWVSDVRLADAAKGDPVGKGVIDVFSHASGHGDPPSTATQGAGAYPLPYVETGRTWGAAPAIAKENKLDIRLDNIASAAIDTARAGLDLSKPVVLAVNATNAATLRMAGVAVAVPSGASTLTVDLSKAAGAVAPGAGAGSGGGRSSLPATGGDGRWGAVATLLAVAGLASSRTVRRCRTSAPTAMVLSSS